MTIPSSRSLILWKSVFSITSPSADFGRLRKSSDFFGNLRKWLCRLQKSQHSQDKNLTLISQKKLAGIQSALLTRLKTDFMSSLWNFLSLSGRSSSLWTISMQQQGVRKYGYFHKLYRAKLQWNAWGMPGGRWAVLELTGWYSKASFSVREVIKPRTLLSLDPPPCSLLLS